MQEFRFERTDIWREGTWLDLWSVVHFLSGISVGFSLYQLGFDGEAATVISLLLLVAYELWEALARIAETPQNRVMDVFVGMMSFLPTYFLLSPRLGGSIFPVFALVLIVNIAMSFFGWRASRKAALLEERMRAEYRAQVERMRERLERLKTDYRRKHLR